VVLILQTFFYGCLDRINAELLTRNAKTIKDNPRFRCNNGFLLAEYGESLVLTLRGLMTGEVVVPRSVRRIEDYAITINSSGKVSYKDITEDGSVYVVNPKGITFKQDAIGNYIIEISHGGSDWYDKKELRISYVV
jgi:hypothetical protein